MKLYIAAQYSRKEEMLEKASALRAMGVEVTSRWMEEDYHPYIQLSEITDEKNAEIADYDLSDIEDADTFLFFSEEHPPKRAGRHVEFGYALALGLDMHVVGCKENIFHYLPEVKKHETFGDFVLSEVVGDGKF
jgi:nucleoside 2-deoxyribosyltransferase